MFSYSLDDPFLIKNEIKWKDEKKHVNNFFIDRADNLADDGMISCEEGDKYVNAVRLNKISKNDLMIIGVNQNNQPIYGISDVNNPILKAAQEQILYAGNEAHDDPRDIVIFWEDPYGKLIRFVSGDIMNACGGKPVIYLYPQKKENVKVALNVKGGFSVTEPEYLNGWDVMASPDGKLKDIKTGKDYPYLFWEGGLAGYETPKEGFVVARQDIKNFFKDKLSYIGLNEKEINDFSDFWVRKMKEKPFYFVTFTLSDDMDKLAPLSIEPKPDTVIRVLMDYEALDESVSVPTQTLPKINRNGFVVVEWGGILR